MSCKSGKFFNIGPEFDPKIVLHRVMGIVNFKLILEGKDANITKNCIICDKEVSESFRVTIQNSSDDTQLAGYICLEHETDYPKIRLAAIAAASTALQRRLEQMNRIIQVNIPIEQ